MREKNRGSTARQRTRSTAHPDFKGNHIFFSFTVPRNALSHHNFFTGLFRVPSYLTFENYVVPTLLVMKEASVFLQ